MTTEHVSVASVLNPLGMSSAEWWTGYLGRFLAVYAFDLFLERLLVRPLFPELPSRRFLKIPRVPKTTVDKCCLLSNSFIEIVFVYNVLALVFVDGTFAPRRRYACAVAPTLSRSRSHSSRAEDHILTRFGADGHSATWTNMLVAPVALFVLDDLLYNLAHRFMHWRPVYPYVHKIHHRQTMPQNGYWDAAVEHPIEQLVGLGIFWATLRFVAGVFGMHVAAFAFCFAFYSFFNVVNHMPYDTTFPFLGFVYAAGAHEMHHRFPNCNYSKSCMLWDHLFGTYRAYETGEKKRRSRPKPSPEGKGD